MCILLIGVPTVAAYGIVEALTKFFNHRKAVKRRNRHFIEVERWV